MLIQVNEYSIVARPSSFKLSIHNSSSNMSATSHIDFRTLPNTVPSLCIPRVYSNINEARIRRVFAELDMGEIERIDVVGKSNEKGDKFNRVFVHFKRWNASENANIARERLLNGKEIKILYDDPWFWKVSAYREPVRRARHQGSGKKATLQVDGYEEVANPSSRRRTSSALANAQQQPREVISLVDEDEDEDEEEVKVKEEMKVKEEVKVKEEPRPPAEVSRQAAQTRWSNRDPPQVVNSAAW